MRLVRKPFNGYGAAAVTVLSVVGLLVTLALAGGSGSQVPVATSESHPAAKGSQHAWVGKVADRSPLSSLPRIPWAGGPQYFTWFPPAKAHGWTGDTFFPVAAWFMRAADTASVDAYREMGFNTTIQVEEQPDLARLRAGGISVVLGNPSWPAGAETVGWELVDEPDMVYMAGTDPWTGEDGWNTCVPKQDEGGKCGFTVLDTLSKRFPSGDGRLRYVNLGKGVFPGWMPESDFATFVNKYTTIVSDDIYWYTDDEACGGQQGPTLIPGHGPISVYSGKPDLTAAECHRSANYGAVVDQLRRLDMLDGKLQPVFGFVETGNPFDTGTRTVSGPQIQGAVMSELIHGASGIIYFKHSFGGSCRTNDNLLDCPRSHRPEITKINRLIKKLAPVLNTQSYAYDFGPGLDTMLKWHDGAAYVFAMGKLGATGVKTLTLPQGLSAATKVQVLDDGRTLTASHGTFTDDFPAEYSYHVYRIAP
jgi:hypothetical protein